MEAFRAIAKVERFYRESRLDSRSEETGVADWGPFAIEKRIGAGSHGDVFLATDRRLGRPVALKLLRSRGREWSSSIVKEGHLLARLNHPNIATVYGADEHEGRVGLWMEYIKGRSLAQLVRDDGPMSEKEAILAGVEVCRALAAVHREGLIHRDVKAQNVMREEGGRILLTDFGIGLDSRRELSKPAGTPVYLAPEIFDGAAASVQSDLYSVGVLLYFLVSASFPVDEPSIDAFREVHRASAARLLRDTRPGLTSTFYRVVERALETDPSARYASAGGMEKTLSDALDLVGETHRHRTPSLSDVHEATTSIAVLPFVDMSVSQDQEYFCDGMAEEILNTLTRYPRLRVVARTSAFKFKGKQADVRRIGRDLRVSTVLEGSVRSADTRLRVTAKLIDVVDGFQLWSEKYDRTVDDVFAIQDDIAQRIVEKLTHRLLARGSRASKPKTNLNAYRSYLKARFHMSRRTADALAKSTSYCEQALTIDEDYAPAHACLADILFLRAFQGEIPPRDVMPRAEAEAAKALAIDPSLGEAHASLACALATFDWNWLQSAQAFRQAIAFNPGSALAHYWYAIWYLVPTGQFEAARAEVDIARTLDPLSPLLSAGMAWQLFFAGEPELALEEIREALEIDANFLMAHDVAAQCYGALGRFKDAVAAAEKAVSLSEDRALSTGILGFALARAGNADAAKQSVNRLLTLRERQYVPAFDIALVYAGLRQTDRALDWLERACEERNGWLVFLGVDPRFDELRTESRFTAIIAALGVPIANRPSQTNP